MPIIVRAALADAREELLTVRSRGAAMGDENKIEICCKDKHNKL